MSYKVKFPEQNLKMPIADVADMFKVSERTARRYLNKLGASKNREQYLADAKTRRKTAYELRQQGLKFKEIADILGISLNNAQQLVRRYKEDNEKNS